MKNCKFSVKTLGAPAEIRIGYLPNTRQERYHLNHLIRYIGNAYQQFMDRIEI
jgi:hypothetical protein